MNTIVAVLSQFYPDMVDGHAQSHIDGLSRIMRLRCHVKIVAGFAVQTSPSHAARWLLAIAPRSVCLRLECCVAFDDISQVGRCRWIPSRRRENALLALSPRGHLTIGCCVSSMAFNESRDLLTPLSRALSSPTNSTYDYGRAQDQLARRTALAQRIALTGLKHATHQFQIMT